jgi:hypothetical protein
MQRMAPPLGRPRTWGCICPSACSLQAASWAQERLGIMKYWGLGQWAPVVDKYVGCIGQEGVPKESVRQEHLEKSCST